MAYRTYQKTRIKRRGMQPQTTAGMRIRPPVAEPVSIDNPVEWGKQCFSWQFKAILRNTLQDRIGNMENKIFNERMQMQAVERRGAGLGIQEKMSTNQSRVNTMKAALEALDAIPDCEGRGF